MIISGPGRFHAAVSFNAAAVLLALIMSCNGAKADPSQGSASGSPPVSPNTAGPKDTPATMPGQNAPLVAAPTQTGITQAVNPGPPPGNAIARFMDKASQDGIYVNLFDVSQLQEVTAGGLQHQVFLTNWAYLGLDLDLQRIAGVSGATIHIVGNDVAGQGRQASFTGSTWATLNNWAARGGMELREFTWDQHFFDDRLLLLAGRFNATSDGFEGSPFFCQFATFMCATPRMFLADTSGPTFQVSTWMARAAFRLDGPLYVKAAVIEEEPSLTINNHGGWPGPDWGLDRSKGTFVPWEFGYNTEYTKDLYPTKLVLGGTYDSIHYADYEYNKAGQLLATHGGVAQMHSGRSTIYLQGQQLVWRPSMTGQSGLNVFATANYLTSGYGVMRASYTAGLFDYGPFSARPLDTIGLAFEDNQFNHREVEAANQRAQAHHDPATQSGNELMSEIIYGVHCTSGVTFSPYAEFIWHPDQLGLATPKPGLSHAVQIGFMLRVNLNQAIGMPLLARLQH